MTNLKPKFCNMNRLSLLFLVVLSAFGPLTAPAAQDTWINNGTIVIPPAIDATNVINNGTLGPLAVTSLFDTSNTKNFTNTGTIANSPNVFPFTSAVGFRFDTAPRDSSGQLIGQRKLAANFHNRNSGVVAAVDGLNFGAFFGSALLVQATNLINQGSLTVGPGGLVQLTGTNVNLSRGAFGVNNTESSAQGSFNDPQAGQFLPDIAVKDNYWEQTNRTFFIDGIISPTGIITTPPHNIQVYSPAGVQTLNNFAFSLPSGSYAADAISNVVRFASVTLTNADASITNFLVPTNVVMQAAFVGVADPNQQVDISFFPSSQPTNDYFSVFVNLLVPATNIFTGQQEFSTVYFQDELAGENARGLLVNFNTTLGGAGVIQTFRPNAYVSSRLQQGLGFAGNAIIGPDFFYAPNYLTNRITGDYAAYSARFDNIVVRPPNLPTGNPTNFSGRAEARSASLDMSRARIRGEGLVLLQTSHLVASSNAAVDCENLSLDLGSTNGLLRIKDITKATVQRVRGDIFAWSGQWSNSYSLLLTNYDTATNPAVPVIITNTVSINYAATIYDTRSLGTTFPVLVQQFKATATNIVMDDTANIVLDFQLKGESFTLNGNVSLSGGVPDWGATNALTLRYFTNNGSLTVPNEAHFGDDRVLNYLGFVNRGNITSFGQNIDSVYTELAGTNIVTGAFNVEAVDAKVDTGRVSAGGDVIFTTDTLKLNKALVQTGGRLTLSVANALLDNGASSSNTITFGDGMILNFKPTTGDLLGTTLRSTSPVFGLVDHFWAGEDRGATRAGFSNNVALGRLVLSPNGFGSAFGFIGTGVANGLYVDLLDLTQLTDYVEQLLIDPNITIYYAAARLSFVPPGGVTPEEFLDGQFGGRLRWVSQFNGPNSSVDVVVNGTQTIQVNRALRNSTTIDSDGDGIPNYFDLTPFDGVIITSITRSTAPAGIALTWNAVPNTVYRVEYTTNSASGWTPLLMTTNTTGVVKPWTAVDTNLNSGPQRQYRISYNPNGL